MIVFALSAMSLGARAAGEEATQLAAAPVADELVIVDCRLPPRVRKLGSNAIYQTAGQLTKVPAKECEIRGGEYTVFDTNRVGDAIKLWLPEANAGDPRAQTNLGTLYERGTPPDYKSAAQWYRAAADQGWAAARTALGRLYEEGLGVEKDMAAALNLYRQVSGVTEKILAFTTSADPDADLSQAKAQLASKESELTRLREELDEGKRKRDELQRQLKSLQNQASPPANALKQQISALDSQLGERQAALKAGQNSSANAGPPMIDILYPPVQRQRGKLEVSMRGGKSDYLVLRATAPAGLDKVTFGSTRVETDQKGYFTVPVSQPGEMSFRVRDLAGQEASLVLALSIGGVEGAKAVPDALRQQAGKYHALLIGSDTFRHWPSLDNAINDAKAVQKVLQDQYNFSTTLVTNASRQALLGALNELRQKLTPQDNLLIYYAGHGHMVQKVDRGYWIPIEAAMDNDIDWILNDQITDYLQLIPARQILVVSDSCYSGVLTRNSLLKPKLDLDEGSRLEVLSELAQRRVRTVMTSGGIQPVLDGGPESEGHSVFTSALLKVLRQNARPLEANRLFEAISAVVQRESAKVNYAQVPTYKALVFAGHQGGDFVFVPK